jgi:hypothetical protein
MKGLAAKTAAWRKGCLIFWKLRPPNLTRKLFAFRINGRKLFVYSLLDTISVQMAIRPEMHPESNT